MADRQAFSGPEMAAAVAAATGLGSSVSERVVGLVLDGMRRALLRRERIEIRGVGVLYVAPKKRGVGRNLWTGQIVGIPRGFTVRF